MLIYSGRVESRDANRLFDAVSSLVEWGDLRLDLATWENPPTAQTREHFPLESAGVEPLQVIAAAPLYLLARALPGIGLAHTVWLFNVLATALAGVVLFVYARALGCRVGAALLAALAFGVATAVFPYTKTFFREPLTLLMLLLVALLADRLRTSSYRSLVALIGLVGALALLVLTRASALFALPALAVIAFPAFRLRRADLSGAEGDGAQAEAQRQRRRALWILIGVGGVLALLAGLLIIFGGGIGTGGRYDVIGRLLEASGKTLPTALQAYLLSVGGSVWGTSPVLLLAIPGAWLLIRGGQPRYPLAILLLILGFAVGYAVFNNVYWFGGLSWPPRFLVPVIGVVLIGALPVFERAARQPLSIWGLLVAALIAYGIWVNLSGVTLDWEAYGRALPPESGRIGEWGPSLNQFEYLRWVVTPTLWGKEPLDIAWSIIDRTGFYTAYGVLAAGTLICLLLFLRGRRSRWITLLPLIGAAAWLIITAVALRTLYDLDQRYQPGETAVEAMLPVIEEQTNRDDVILLGSPKYVPFFENRGKLFDAGRVIGLELQYGDRVSEAEPAQVESDYPPALLTKETSRLITNLALTRDRLWLLVDGGPDLWWSVRPVERYLSSYYYPVRTISTSPLTHLIEYSTIPAPDPFAFRGAQMSTDLRFGDSIRLQGLTLPAGMSAQPGGVVAVSLYWVSDAPLTSRYTMALYLRDSAGNAVAQSDSQPLDGFAPTDGWTPGVPQWDHRGMRLPADLPPGSYPLWVKVYDFAPDGTVRDLPVTSGDSLDGVIGVLPVTINVGSSSEIGSSSEVSSSTGS